MAFKYLIIKKRHLFLDITFTNQKNELYFNFLYAIIWLLSGFKQLKKAFMTHYCHKKALPCPSNNLLQVGY